MALYQFNMAGDLVLTLEKRRFWFRWLLTYLGVSIVVIAAVAYHLAASVVDLTASSRALDAREKQFLNQRPGVNSLDASLKKVTAELAGVSASLDAVAQFRAMGQKSADILLGLAESLPPGVDFGRVALDGNEGTAKVEVYVPMSLKQDGGLTLPNVISRWENSVLLTNRIHQITSENSQRVNFEGREYLSWRFTGVLEKDH